MNHQTNTRNRKNKKQGGGCLGCMSYALFALVLSVGLVAFTGNGQRVADGIALWVQDSTELRLIKETFSLDFLPGQTPQSEDVQTEQTQAQPITETTADVLLAYLESKTTIFDDDIPRYFYTTLTDAEKISYLLVVECVFDMAEQAEIPPQGSTALEDIWVMIRADFPELFWVESSLTRTLTSSDVQQIFFIPTYSITAAERATQEAELVQAASLYYASLALITDPTDYQKVQAAYEFVITQVSYQITDQDQTVYGALVQGQAVCAGYTRAVQYLLNRVGVVCGYVAGDASGTEGSVTHAWNFVQIDGEYYYLDATWGEGSWGAGVDYSYLCVNENDLATTHFADAIYNLPAVTGTAYNYYRVQGYYLETYTLAEAQAAMDGQQDAGYYTLRFASAEALQAAMASLIDAQEIYDVLRALGTPTNRLSYTYKEGLNVLIVFSQEE